MNNTEYPDLNQAMDMVRHVQKEYRRYYGEKDCSYTFHAMMVAACAESLASQIPGIDQTKACVLGLLHDYGKFFPSRECFHGLAGYKYFMEKGWDSVARVCLTHSFPDQNFIVGDYPSYPADDIAECREIISTLKYDIYDRLIQISDILVCVNGYKNLKERARYLRAVYNIPPQIVKKFYSNSLRLKFYFDKLCGCDIYKILMIG